MATPKNKPTLDFLKGSPFVETAEGLFTWDTANAYPLPSCIQLEGQGFA